MVSAKRSQANMKATRRLHFQDCAESCRASMCLILSSTLQHQGLISLSIFLARRKNTDLCRFNLPLRSFFSVKLRTMSICESFMKMLAMFLYFCNMNHFCILVTYHCSVFSSNRGYLADRKKPIIFSMARLDVVKNITGLVEWFGKNEKLRNLVNLVVVGGFFDPSKSKDREEMAEIRKMHELIDKYQLKGQIRWIAAQTDRRRNGELYRCIADTKGAFVQPALYEAFGLTVIEAMNCGLPTFATNQGVQLRS